MNILSRQSLACSLALAGLLLTCPAQADPPASLLPVFGSDGAEFSTKAEKGNLLHGWLPNGWTDNSEWAPISATYSLLEDRPDDTYGAVRIKVEKMDDGQLQITSYTERTYEKGKPYRVRGWLRSPQKLGATISVRQMNEPYEAFFEGDVASDTVWKPFEFSFQPEKDIKGIVMLAVKEVGTMDVAGITVSQGGPPPSFLPVLGTEGREFTTQAKDGHTIHGWMPTDWDDNSEWAAVDATYSRLEDPPSDTLGGLRIKVEKIDGDGRLQITSYAGERDYAKGKTYRVSGWVRSPDRLPLTIEARQSDEPYTAYHEGEVATGKEWKPFAFDFRPHKDIKALVMLAVEKKGTIDLAGVTVGEAGPEK